MNRVPLKSAIAAQSLLRQSIYPLRTQIGVRPLVIQRRFFLKPFFRLAKSGVAVAAGAAAGTAAYAQYKFEEASSSVRDSLNKAGDWLKGVYDDFDGFSGNNGNGGEGGTAGSEGGRSTNNTTSATSTSGASGGDGGDGDDKDKDKDSSELSAAATASTVGATGDSGNSNSEPENSSEDDSMLSLTKQMIEIRSILMQIESTENVQLPSIVVVGSQSSGKSSVLEAIVGHEFLPKGANMVTKRPIELTLVRTEQGETDYCEFPNMRLRNGKFTNFKDVQRLLTELNHSVDPSEVVSDEPIRLRVCSPNVPDLTLIDLPGYIQVVAADQPLSLRQKISDLCDKYIQAPNVILAVSAADVDLANSTALQACRRVDPLGERTIGVITKMDLVDATHGRNTLLTRDYPLRMGYVGVVTQVPKVRSLSLTHLNQRNQPNLTQQIADSESEFFSEKYADVDWGVLQLRKKLANVLSYSMAQSLDPAIKNIKREQEETSYAFKVRYNDRVLTPQTYLAHCADEFKALFQEMSTTFGREEVKTLIKHALDQKGLDLLAEQYWSSADLASISPGSSSGSSSGSSTSFISNASSNSSTNTSSYGTSTNSVPSLDNDQLHLLQKLDEMSAALTKAGVGRLSTNILVEAILERMNEIKLKSKFKNHPLALEQIDKSVQKILNTKYYATADQIENSIKPYKYEVDVDAKEWSSSREYAYGLVAEELEQCTVAFDKIRTQIGSRRLNALMTALTARARGEVAESLDQYSTDVVKTAEMALFLKQRQDILKARSTFIKATKCKSRKNKALCPEVFMDVITTKLTATSVLFLNFELLSDFYYSFPRELDAALQSLSENQVVHLATQDPEIKEHVEMQHKKELLSLALEKLQAASDFRNMREKRYN